MAGKKRSTPLQKAGEGRPKENQDPSFPGLKTGGVPKAAATDYEALQKDELLALKAIYPDDFVEHGTAPSAWKKSEPRFDIRIKAFADDDVKIVLSVVMTATYPRTAPILTLKELDNLKESTLFKIQALVKTKPKLLVQRGEDAIINDIVEDIREILDEAAEAKAAGRELPSLEEERAAHEAETARLAEEEREKEELKRLEATKEEQRVLDGLLQEEVKRQKTKAIEIRRKNRTTELSPNRSLEDPTDSATLVFDQPCRLTDSSGNTSLFDTVIGRTLYRTGPISTVYTVRPVLKAGEQRCNLALKQAELKPSGKDNGQYKKQVQALEAMLESAKKRRHKNILEVMGFRIDRGSPSTTAPPSSSTEWTISMLTPFAERGSLEDLLEMAGQVVVDKARGWTRDLLEALNFLHSSAITHKSIHPSNVLLFRDASGSIIPKLADAAFQRELHDICRTTRAVTTSMREGKSVYWLPPEIAGVAKPHYTHKTDIWDFGVMFLQMIFGIDVPEKYHSPKELMDSLSLSPELDELVSGFFNSDPSKRKRAFDLGSHHFLATNAQILAEDSSAIMSDSLVTLPQFTGARLRHGSMSRAAIPSRWAREWVEEGRLGKGGFGEVVKARNVVENAVYAVKKIRQRANESLTSVVSEVSVFSKMSHPSVVRYVTTWVEQIIDPSEQADLSSSGGGGTTESISQDLGAHIEFEATGHGALDFVSSSRPPIDIGFDTDDNDNDAGTDEDDSEDDSEDADEDEDDDDEDSDGEESSSSAKGGRALVAQPQRRRRRRSQLPFRTILYMVMEYCEKRTLRDLIAKNLYQDRDEIWKLFRQILEGLQHIHGWDIIHRDLKPENIFIKIGADGSNVVKIGDFGLATAGMRAIGDEAAAAAHAEVDNADMTRSVGTTTYLAPEVRSSAKGTYTTKCDMYALGIIFFEMCYRPMMGMERAKVFEDLRRPHCVLPDDFQNEKNARQIVPMLVTHVPEQRPSATELLKSGLLPVEMESDAMRQVMAGLSDPSNAHYNDYVSQLFKRPIDQAKDYTWDMANVSKDPQELMRLHVAKGALVSIFRRHGAVEVPRSSLYPPSSLYATPQNTVQVVDRHGALLQLPYDLMMGNARVLAKITSGGRLVGRSYSFGTVFRDKPAGGQPHTFGEAHFDVVTDGTSDMALREAEAIKVLDEIIGAFPSLSHSQMCFHLGHSELLRHIFAYCGVEPASTRTVADILSKLNSRNVSWQKTKSELRSAGVSATAVDELQRFDFRDAPGNKIVAQLRQIFQRSDYLQRVSPTLAHLKEVSDYCKALGVRTKIYVSPLWSWNEVFFNGCVMFGCVFDKQRSKEVFAAGGRYDSLIKELRPKISTQFQERHAVGFGFNWEVLSRVPKTASGAFSGFPGGGGGGGRTTAAARKAAAAAAMAAGEEDSQIQHGIFATRRCDVLIASFDPTTLRSTGLDILQTLWAHDVSAELARDARSPEELLNKHRDGGHSWVVIIKPDTLKIKTPGRRDAPDVDIPPSQLLNWLRAEIRDRDARAMAFAAGSGGGVGGAMGSGGGGGGGGGGSMETGAGGGGHSYHYNRFYHHHDPALSSTSLLSSGGPSGGGGFGFGSNERDVRVLIAQTKSKKFNRQAVVDQAQVAASKLVSSFLSGPVLAIETTDAVMDLLRGTSLSDAESWRRAEQAVTTAERNYIREVREQLEAFRAAAAAAAAASDLSSGNTGGGGGAVAAGSGSGPASAPGGGGLSSSAAGSRPAFVYNFRTSTCIYYDLGG